MRKRKGRSGVWPLVGGAQRNWEVTQSHLAVQEADLRLLSVRYELSGGEIRNIAVRALARGESSLAVLEAECQSELRNRTGRASRALGI